MVPSLPIWPAHASREFDMIPLSSVMALTCNGREGNPPPGGVRDNQGGDLIGQR